MKEKKNIPSVKNFESRVRSMKDTVEKNSEQMILDKTPLELYHLVKNNNFNLKPVDTVTKYHKGLDKTDIYQAVWAIHCHRYDLEITTIRDIVDNYDMMTLIKMTPSLGTVRAVALYKFIETTGVKMKIWSNK